MSDSWPHVALDQICERITDGTHHSPTNLPSGDFRYVTAKNIRPWGLDLSDISYVDRKTHREIYSRCPVERGDVLYIKDGVTTGLAVVNPLEDQFSMLSSVALLKPRRDVLESSYLKHWLNSPLTVAKMTSEMTGTAIKRLVLRQIRAARIPLPPIGQQRLIADKLNALLAKIDACRGRLERVPQILKRFREAVLEAAVSGRLTEGWRSAHGINDRQLQSFVKIDGDAFRGYEFPSSWKTSRLSEIADIAGGITKDSKRQGLRGEELPYLRVANVQRGFLNLTEMKTIRVRQDRVESLLLRPGDMLFNEGGDIDKLGRGWIWEGQIDRCVFQNHVFRGRLRDTRFAPRFYSHYANSRGFDYFLARGKQTTNLASINKTTLSSLPVPVPTIEEQTEIVRRIGQLFEFGDSLERRYRNAARDVDVLTPSVLAKAFRGELVPQDPNDEPTGQMLERVRAVHAGETAPTMKIRAARSKGS